MTWLCSLLTAVFSVRLENGPDAEPSFTHFLHILPHFQSDPISSLQEAPPHGPTRVKILTSLAETPDRAKDCHFVSTHCNQLVERKSQISLRCSRDQDAHHTQSAKGWHSPLPGVVFVPRLLCLFLNLLMAAALAAVIISCKYYRKQQHPSEMAAVPGKTGIRGENAEEAKF